MHHPMFTHRRPSPPPSPPPPLPGVVHRDLKPENLLLASADDDTNVKIADFGFAKHTQDLGQERAICGTADYIAPEILSARKYGPAVDIWSSGVIAYILLGGYPPFYSDDETELFRIIQSGVFECYRDAKLSDRSEFHPFLSRNVAVGGGVRVAFVSSNIFHSMSARRIGVG